MIPQIKRVLVYIVLPILFGHAAAQACYGTSYAHDPYSYNRPR